MYQIINTFKCNFRCDHCMFSCHPRRKEMLSDYDFIDFIKYFCDGEMVNICGGETFLHPNVNWQLNQLSYSFNEVRVVTNGSWVLTKSGNYTQKFKNFINECGHIQNMTILVSDDWYHEKFLKHSVKNIIRAFEFETDIRMEKDRRKINGYIAPLGRALKTECYTNTTNSCECHDNGEYRFDPCLLPNGDIASCCNGKYIVGNVRNSYKELYDRFINNPPRARSIMDCNSCKYKPNTKKE